MFGEAEVIHCYSRSQAIEDGVLIDVSSMAREAGFQYPVALSSAAWVDCVEWDNDNEVAYQDESGRLWDVLWMAKDAIRRARSGDSRLRFVLFRVSRGNKRPSLAHLDMVVGPGDDLEPVITIMQHGED